MDDSISDRFEGVRTTEYTEQTKPTNLYEVGMSTDCRVAKRREDVINDFVLINVVNDKRPSVERALEALWKANVRTVGDVRGKRLHELFAGHGITPAQQKKFAEALHPFEVYLD